jgi:hypothetical protein
MVNSYRSVSKVRLLHIGSSLGAAGVLYAEYAVRQDFDGCAVILVSSITHILEKANEMIKY